MSKYNIKLSPIFTNFHPFFPFPPISKVAYMRDLHHDNLVPLETSTLLPCNNNNNISMATSVVMIVMPFYRVGGWMEGWVDGWKDGWMDERMGR